MMLDFKLKLISLLYLLFINCYLYVYNILQPSFKLLFGKSIC